MQRTLEDLRYAARKLGRAPGFTLVAALTLGIGLAVNITMFSTVNGILLRPFPYPEPEELIVVGQTETTTPDDVYNLSYPDYLTIAEDSEAIDEIAVWDWEPYSLRGEGDPVFVGGLRVSAGFFDVLGAKTAPGPDLPAGGGPAGRAPGDHPRRGALAHRVRR